jgi:hypothetical protein
MTAPRKVTVNLPFPGFYNSAYSDAIDQAESQWLEYHGDEYNGETDSDYESAWPEPLRLSNDLGDLLWRHTDYSAAYQRVARDYVAALDDLAGEAFGLTVPDKRTQWTWNEAAGTHDRTAEPYARPSIRMTFESMDSPREYNFSTDRIYGEVPLKVVRELFRRSKAEGHATLTAIIARRFTSRSGFMSFYPSDLAEWLAKAGPLAEWDHNQLGTLFLAGLAMAGQAFGDGSPYDSDTPEGRLYDETVRDEGAYQAWESCVDWPAFEAARAEARAERLADWRLSDPDAARAWIRDNAARAAELATADSDIPSRCTLTLEMFA